MTCETDAKQKRDGVLVIGGAIVEADPIGKCFAKFATVRYLAELASSFRAVYFMAGLIAKQAPVYRSAIRPPIHFRTLSHVNKVGLQRFVAKLRDTIAICSTARGCDAALEFFPSAGGVLGSVLLACFAKRYVVYFGTDPQTAYRSVSLSLWPKQLIKRFGAWVASQLADSVLVRDPICYRRLCASGLSDKVQLSSPITGLVELRDPPEPRPITTEVNLLYIGVFSARKGILTLFEVLKQLLQEDQRYKLTIVGAPEMLGPDTYSTEFLWAHCEAMGVSHRVAIVDYIDEMGALQRVYGSADIFLLASRREGFPRVVEEAMLNRVAVVAFALPCLEAVLQSNVHAVLVPSGDVTLFVESVALLVKDSDLRARLTRNGYQLMRSRFRASASEQHTQALLGK